MQIPKKVYNIYYDTNYIRYKKSITFKMDN